MTVCQVEVCIWTCVCLGCFTSATGSISGKRDPGSDMASPNILCMSTRTISNKTNTYRFLSGKLLFYSNIVKLLPSAFKLFVVLWKHIYYEEILCCSYSARYMLLKLFYFIVIAVWIAGCYGFHHKKHVYIIIYLLSGTRKHLMRSSHDYFWYKSICLWSIF